MKQFQELDTNAFDTETARVEYFKLGYEDHGILTFWVGLNYKGSGQGFGGYALDSYDKKSEKRCGSIFGSEVILRLLRCFNVDDIGEIKGKPILVLYPKGSQKYDRKIIGLAPLPCDEGEPFLIDEAVAYCKTLETEQ